MIFPFLLLIINTRNQLWLENIDALMHTDTKYLQKPHLNKMINSKYIHRT